MHAQLVDFFARPEPFSRYTTRRLWTDAHVARQMLAAHLDPGHDLASRRPATIDGFVSWLDGRIGLAGRRVLDIGCGPGLYCERMARRGAYVTGLDFSAHSLAHARRSATAAGLSVAYRDADYLVDPLPGPVDLVTLIYGDYCALSPDRRRLLLGRIAEILAPGGRFVLDLFSPGQFAALREVEGFAHHRDGGFWAEGDHYVFNAAFLYPEASISLERYLVVRPEESFEICNWMQYYTPSAIAAELAAAGYRASGALDFATGTPWQASATAFAVVAERA